jgi:hypothetical protein
MTHKLIIILLALALSCVTGCGSVQTSNYGGKLSVRGEDDRQQVVTTRFTESIYSFDGNNSVTFLLSEGPIESTGTAVVIRMFWRPRVARTPIDTTATNATIHYVVFAPNGSVGVYEGAGFVYPSDDPGRPSLAAGLWQSTIRLADGSMGFEDTIGRARLAGDFSAPRNDVILRQQVRQLNQRVAEQLGYPRMVRR